MDYPENTIVSDLDFGIKYIWQGSTLQPYVDPSVVESIDEAIDEISGN